MEENIGAQQTLPRADAEEKDFCEGRAEAVETVVHKDRDTARSEAKKLARASAKAVCAEKRECGGGSKCKLTDVNTRVEVRPTQEIDEPRTYTATATVTGRCSC